MFYTLQHESHRESQDFSSWYLCSESGSNEVGEFFITYLGASQYVDLDPELNLSHVAKES